MSTKALFAALVLCVVAVLVAQSHSLEISNLRTTAVNDKPVGIDWCSFCVSFSDEAIQNLINIIANGGIIGGCSALCSKLPKQLEAAACDLLCSFVGIDLFIHYLEKADLDPIYYCQLLKMCPIHDCQGNCANVTSVVVTPSAGPIGTKFSASLEFSIFQEVGAGEISVAVIPPNAPAFGDAELVSKGFEPGSYSARFGFTAQPSEFEPFSPGTYKFRVNICEGMCHNKHPHSQVLSTGETTFDIVHK